MVINPSGGSGATSNSGGDGNTQLLLEILLPVLLCLAFLFVVVVIGGVVIGLFIYNKMRWTKVATAQAVMFEREDAADSDNESL